MVFDKFDMLEPKNIKGGFEVGRSKKSFELYLGMGGTLSSNVVKLKVNLQSFLPNWFLLNDG